MRALQAKPASFGNWAATKKWKSSVEDVPKNSGNEAYEKWLWKESA
jgi:hypothetical protein